MIVHSPQSTVHRLLSAFSFQLKRIAVLLMLAFFVFTNVSCAKQPEKNQLPVASSQLSVPGPRPASSELVYLKVESVAVSSFDESPDWAPKPDQMAAADNDMETRWSSGYEDNEWICLDFGKVKTVSQVRINWEQAYAKKFEILVSSDHQNWKTIALLENQSGGINVVEFKPVAARYIKLMGLERVNAEWGISIWEFEPFGPKEDNPGESPKEEVSKIRQKVPPEIEKILAGLNIVPGETKPSPGAITTVEFQKGVNYTSWSSDELFSLTSDSSLVYLSRHGVRHIALMAVYYQDDAESKNIYADEKKTSSDESLIHAINVIHALGMKVMLKPHVDLVDEEARSNIIPSDEWFKSYKDFILHYAQLASKCNVEIFCIGTELSNTTTTRWNEKWSDIIGSLRNIYKGPITYAANWDEYDSVSFWPNVDYIGIDAYFPLTNKNNPPKDELSAAWKKHADILESWLKSNNLTQPVIFTEIGYDTIEGSNKQPWRIIPTLAQYSESQQEQANCLEALLTVLSKRSWFKGLYWWNYFPRSDIGQLGYTLRGKIGEKVLTEWYSRLK